MYCSSIRLLNFFAQLLTGGRLDKGSCPVLFLLSTFLPRRSYAPETTKRVRAADRSNGRCAHEFWRTVRTQHEDTIFASCSRTAHTRRAACVHAMKGAYTSCEARTPHAKVHTHSAKAHTPHARGLTYTSYKRAYIHLM